ncbi:MAG: transglutaminase domain-containing protein [Clostridia bacterium]|nr:transglutaminase domain-containing protein [Clostridia bacterium]
MDEEKAVEAENAEAENAEAGADVLSPDGDDGDETFLDEGSLLLAEKRDINRRAWKSALLLLVLAAVFAAAVAVYNLWITREMRFLDENYRLAAYAVRGDSEFSEIKNAMDFLADPDDASYSSRICYGRLNDAEKMIYRSLEHAMLRGWEEIYLDQALLEESRYGAAELLVILAMDSPLMEQNLSYVQAGRFVRMIQTRRGILPLGIMMEGERLVVANFSPRRLAKKQEAVAEARRILEELSPAGSEREIAETLFTYLTDNVRYDDEKHFAQSDYLYDALVSKETNCDGFANAFSLLARLCGLTCFEKDFVPEDRSAGHTWNCVRLDGVWYNLDASNGSVFAVSAGNGEPLILSEAKEVARTSVLYFTFGFSDGRQSHPHRYEELTPVCEADLFAPDLVLEGVEEGAAAALIADALRNKGNELLLVETSRDISEEKLQAIANSVGSYTYEWAMFENKVLYVLKLDEA